MDDSEFDVIEKYFLPLGEWSLGDTRVGPGDDCAVVQVPDSRQLCISTDSLLEGVHFPTGANGQLVARRSMAAAISDLAAMGATPFGMTGALTLVAVSAAWLKQFSSVVGDLIERWQIPLLGGNLSQGSELSITWTVMGLVDPGQYLLRSGALADDDIYISGYPGRAGYALENLLQGRAVDVDLEMHYSHPTPRLELGQLINGLASAAIDVSDGLLADLQHLLTASGVGARIDLARLSVDSKLFAASGEADGVRLALTAGDDYEVCFTAPIDQRKPLEQISEQLQLPITRIGKIIQARVVEFENAPRQFDPATLTAQPGYRHFK
jgi:thiamine-monophosphate kinase